MINPVSSTKILFQGYKQNFTDKEFQAKLESSLCWADENVDYSKYFLPKKMVRNCFKRNVKNGLGLLEKYKIMFKKAEFEPVVDLSLQENNLTGKISYYNSKPIEITSELPANLNKFFKRVFKVAKLRVMEQELKQDLWKLLEEEKYLEASQRKRFKELTPKGEETPNPLLLSYDAQYLKLTEKLVEILNKKNALCGQIEELMPKLKNHQFKLKLK